MRVCYSEHITFLNLYSYHFSSAVLHWTGTHFTFPRHVFVSTELLIAMEKQSKVEFRNVGQMYFPQSRVECHYSLTSHHHWTNKDWIGLFKV